MKALFTVESTLASIKELSSCKYAIIAVSMLTNRQDSAYYYLSIEPAWMAES